MNQTTIEAYQAHRAKGYSPRAFRTYQNQVEPLDWDTDHGGSPSASWEEGGFTIHASFTVDPWTPDYPGTFGATWKPGAVPHQPGIIETLDWFYPVNDYEAHRSGLCKLGFTKHESHTLATQYVQRDYERACRYGDDWVNYVLKVSASREGIELGVDYLGGIESDSGDDYFTMSARDVAWSAISEANEKLAKLCHGEGVAC